MRIRRALSVLFVLVLACWACSADAPESKQAEGLKDKTPVVQPEDVHGRDTEVDEAAGPATKTPGSAKAQADEAAGETAQGEPAKTREAAATAAATAAGTAVEAGPLSQARQLLLVTTPSWKASRGVAALFERKNAASPWKRVGGEVDCVVGRNGLGWGRGLEFSDGKGPVKREGDGRSPAGAFPLTAAFGAASKKEAGALGFRLDYTRISPNIVCVTDPGSAAFNTLADSRKNVDWTRNDRMSRASGVNDWGVVIGHNLSGVASKAGSCVFLNIRPGGGKATGGSVGLPKKELLDILSRLAPQAHPALVALPKAEYDRLRAAWRLP